MSRRAVRRAALAAGSVVVALAWAAGGWRRASAADPPAPPLPAWSVPENFDDVPIPAANPMTAEKVELGRRLYYDKRLSGDGKLACYSCHVCEHGLTDGRPTAIGAFGKSINRAAPTLWNIAYHDSLYWDGRSASLEALSLAAWKGPGMGAKPDSIAGALQRDAYYAQAFAAVFGGGMTPERAAQALSAYMRTILCTDTAWDRWERGDKQALSAAQVRGWEVFRKAGCATCHAGNLFTDLRYHNVGIGSQAQAPDPGRFKVTQMSADMGAFKTPTLRDVARSAPYFHDGSVASLEDAVELMARGGIDNPHKDPQLRDAQLEGDDEQDLLEFLKALDCPCDAAAMAPRGSD
jgi:cytochrome c peroxidase